MPGPQTPAPLPTCCLQSPLGACSLRRISPRNAFNQERQFRACCRNRFPSGVRPTSGRIQNIVVRAPPMKPHSRGENHIDVRLHCLDPTSELTDARTAFTIARFWSATRYAPPTLVCSQNFRISPCRTAIVASRARFGQDCFDKQTSIASNSTKRRHAPTALSRLAAP